MVLLIQAVDNHVNLVDLERTIFRRSTSREILASIKPRDELRKFGLHTYPPPQLDNCTLLILGISRNFDLFEVSTFNHEFVLLVRSK